MSPVDRAGSLTGTNFILGSYETFQPGFRDEKRPKTSCGAKFEKQIITFTPIIALATLIAVSLQLNGMLMMWKIQQTMQDNAEFIRRIHPAFIPVTGLKCSYGKIFSPLTEIPVGKTEISGTEPAYPLIMPEHIENFTKDSEVRREIGNRASPVNRAHMKRP